MKHFKATLGRILNVAHKHLHYIDPISCLVSAMPFITGDELPNAPRTSTFGPWPYTRCLNGRWWIVDALVAGPSAMARARATGSGAQELPSL